MRDGRLEGTPALCIFLCINKNRSMHWKTRFLSLYCEDKLFFFCITLLAFWLLAVCLDCYVYYDMYIFQYENVKLSQTLPTATLNASEWKDQSHEFFFASTILHETHSRVKSLFISYHTKKKRAAYLWTRTHTLADNGNSWRGVAIRLGNPASSPPTVALIKPEFTYCRVSLSTKSRLRAADPGAA